MSKRNGSTLTGYSQKKNWVFSHYEKRYDGTMRIVYRNTKSSRKEVYFLAPTKSSPSTD